MNKTIHIIGGGLAGLSCAVRLLKDRKKKKIILYESSTLFGGRCRSYSDKDFKCYLDNGNHLIIKAYKNTFKYLINTLPNFIFLGNHEKISNCSKGWGKPSFW